MPRPSLTPSAHLPPPSVPLDLLRAAAAAAGLVEAWLYLARSHRSRRRQSEALRDLDDWLRRDIGLPRRGPPPLDPWPGRGW